MITQASKGHAFHACMKKRGIMTRNPCVMCTSVKTGELRHVREDKGIYKRKWDVERKR